MPSSRIPKLRTMRVELPIVVTDEDEADEPKSIFDKGDWF